MTKPELVIGAGSLTEIEAYVEAGADAVQIGDERFAMRMPGNIAESQLAEAVDLAHRLGAKAYVVANMLLDNDRLEELPQYLRRAAEAKADAIVFGDPAVLLAAREAGIQLPFHWNTEMTVTNYRTANYWGRRGATRAILARELNMEQVLEFKRNTTLEVQVQVHGMTNLFHSKRRLVANYYDHLGKPVRSPAELGPERQLYLVEEERQDEQYPIYEDLNGTHIMSGDDVCMIENLEELLEGGIDSFKIEGLLKPVEYNVTVLRQYRQAIDEYAKDPASYAFRQEWLEAIERIQPPNRPLTYGFFYKEQIY